MSEKDSLKINGLCLELNLIMPFILIRGVHSNILPDSVEYYQNVVTKRTETEINGVNLSFFGPVGELQINGINIGGLNTVINKLTGVSITGLNNFIYSLNGISIALIRNRSTIVKGVQIGMVNKATDLRGFQFGLWNINEKRKLPFINWQFSSKK